MTERTSNPAKSLPDEFELQLRDLKLEAMAEFAAGAGHEINNPVATIAGRAALLLKSETDPERRRALETIGGQALRIRDMIGDAMTFARPPMPVRQVFDAPSAIRQVVARFEDELHAVGGHFQLLLPDSLQINADPEQFQVVVACLLKNSLAAVSTGGEISVCLDTSPVSAAEPAAIAILSVKDDGRGLSAAEREHLFDPFFSGRQAGRGLGFGLSRCWRIVMLHGGRIEARPNDGRGLAVVTEWQTASGS